MKSQTSIALLGAALGLIVCLTGCDQKTPAPKVDRHVPALHDFEADRQKEHASASSSASAPAATIDRHVPRLHDFEADRQKAKK